MLALRGADTTWQCRAGRLWACSACKVGPTQKLRTLPHSQEVRHSKDWARAGRTSSHNFATVPERLEGPRPVFANAHDILKYHDSTNTCIHVDAFVYSIRVSTLAFTETPLSIP
ncbi:hypothetical protein NDU88_003361 [Pleurodeles waltl]|uniref:Uncharacterized protein n=1 Tax=Pleurodeles waltl TaxID=8319 RepID=A0AAV7M5Z6_PLEWA|nr:hypothetical protein NDU88_003361 [Pleurodeles waltl]